MPLSFENFCAIFKTPIFLDSIYQSTIDNRAKVHWYRERSPISYINHSDCNGINREINIFFSFFQSRLLLTWIYSPNSEFSRRFRSLLIFNLVKELALEIFLTFFKEQCFKKGTFSIHHYNYLIEPIEPGNVRKISNHSFK